MAVGALGRPPGAPRGRLVAPAMAPRDRLSVLSKLLTQIWPYPLFDDSNRHPSLFAFPIALRFYAPSSPLFARRDTASPTSYILSSLFFFRLDGLAVWHIVNEYVRDPGIWPRFPVMLDA